MGNLKLGNIKTKTHLKDSIEYILQAEKTENGLWVFGNSGVTTPQIQEAFKDTKDIWQKHSGRQAYHYMLTFAKEDDVSPAQVKEITDEFMERLFHGEYDWVGSVHLDTDHIHSHIIFNSVNRVDGYKYRYEKGDWEEKIQKVVDQICNDYGLRTIAYDIDEQGVSIKKEKEEADKTGTNFEKYNPKHKNRNDMIREDIDRCVMNAENIDEFIKLMNEDGYEIKSGNSKKYGNYFTFKPYGAEKGVRSYRLGEGYTFENIKEKINKELKEPEKPHVLSEENKVLEEIAALPVLTYRHFYVKQIFIARHWKNRQPFKNSYKYKRAIIEANDVLEEYNMLKKLKFKNIGEMEKFKKDISGEMRILYKEKKSTEDILKRLEIDKRLKDLRKNKKVVARLIDNANKINHEINSNRDERREVKR